MKKKRLMITLLLVISILMFVGFAYAYLAAGVNNDDAQEASITTGTMNLTFADGTSAFQAKEINIGESVTKTFTIENTGTLKATASMYFKDLKNTYMERSLIYTLEYSTRENGTYKVLRKDATMPRSEGGAKELVYGRITVPAGEKRYYKLTVSFIDIGIDQTQDLNATFNTSFTLESGHDTTSESDKTLAALGLEEYLNEGKGIRPIIGGDLLYIYAAEDNYGTSYYFNGEDMGYNNLIMGTIKRSTDDWNEDIDLVGEEISWKIIRINGDGTLRIAATSHPVREYPMYDSVLEEQSSPANHSGFWSPTYGYLNKEKEEWYYANLHEDYSNYISWDTMFCFDTNYYKKEYVTYETYAGIFEGYVNSYDAQLRETNPSLYCNLPKDGSNSGQTRLTGNNGLNAPIATLTLDELLLAGMSTSYGESESFIPTPASGSGLVTMTPYQTNFLIHSAGGDQVTNGLYGNNYFGNGNALGGVGYDDDDDYPVTYPVINLTAEYAREFVWDAAQNAYVHP